LIEVLVAFSLLSLALAVILQLFSTGLRNAAAIEKQTQAVVLADSILASVGNEVALIEGDTNGEEGEFRWRLSILPVPDETPYVTAVANPAQLYQVYLSVQWQRGSKTVETRLSTLRTGPAE
jgi:general secretion pathway protein I